MTANAQPGPDEIRADIERTRARMGDTLEELGTRLNPSRLKEHAKEAIHDATIGRVQTMARNTMDKAGNAGRSATDYVRENPIPLALIALGAGWLIFSNRKSSTPARIEGSASADIDEFGIMDSEMDVDSSPGIADRAREKASVVADGAQRAVHGVAHTAGNAASTVSRQARAQVSRAGDAFQEQPLVLGAITAAIGLAAGLTIPATRVESELVGEKRDELMDKARDLVTDKVEQVRHVAERVAGDVKTSAKEAIREEGLAR